MQTMHSEPDLDKRQQKIKPTSVPEAVGFDFERVMGDTRQLDLYSS
jgi:hypothetical protein